MYTPGANRRMKGGRNGRMGGLDGIVCMYIVRRCCEMGMRHVLHRWLCAGVLDTFILDIVLMITSVFGSGRVGEGCIRQAISHRIASAPLGRLRFSLAQRWCARGLPVSHRMLHRASPALSHHDARANFSTRKHTSANKRLPVRLPLPLSIRAKRPLHTAMQ